MKLNRILLTLALLIGVAARAAESVDIPEEELARETVLPRFDRPDNVKNRNVVTNKRIEVGGYLGSNTTEPIYNQMKLGVNIGYHWSEESAIVVNYAKWMSGRNSQYVPTIEDRGKLDFGRVPNLEWSLWANYELKNYYGKISFTKQGVMNLMIYPIAGLGFTKYTNKTYPGFNGGIGQKFFFTKNIAMRVDFKIQYQQQPNPFLKEKLLVSNTDRPGPGDFEDKWGMGMILDVGATYMF